MGKGHRLWWYCPGLQAHINRCLNLYQNNNNNNNNNTPQPTMSQLPHQGSAQGSRPTQPNRETEPDRKERQRERERCTKRGVCLLVASQDKVMSDSTEHGLFFWFAADAIVLLWHFWGHCWEGILKCWEGNFACWCVCAWFATCVVHVSCFNMFIFGRSSWLCWVQDIWGFLDCLCWYCYCVFHIVVLHCCHCLFRYCY